MLPYLAQWTKQVLGFISVFEGNGLDSIYGHLPAYTAAFVAILNAYHVVGLGGCFAL